MERIISFSELEKLIYTAQLPNGMQTRIIAIDGCGGAGKSTLAQMLSSHLMDCPIIHTDDFASWDNPLSWYTRMIEQVLNPLSENKVSEYQKYDWSRRTLTDWIRVEPSKAVIIEGVSSSRHEFRCFLTFSIFVRTNRDLRLKRGLERDGESALGLWTQWMKQEDEYVQRDEPEKFVDLVVDGERSHLKSKQVLILD